MVHTFTRTLFTCSILVRIFLNDAVVQLFVNSEKMQARLLMRRFYSSVRAVPTIRYYTSNSKDTNLSYSDEVAQEINKRFGDKREELESPDIQEKITSIANEIRQKHIDKFMGSLENNTEYPTYSQNKSTTRAQQIRMRSKKEQEERRMAAN